MTFLCIVIYRSQFAGIYADIAGARHEYWSSFASRPVEVILAAGQKAKDENSSSKIPSAPCLLDSTLDQCKCVFQKIQQLTQLNYKCQSLLFSPPNILV